MATGKASATGRPFTFLIDGRRPDYVGVPCGSLTLIGLIVVTSSNHDWRARAVHGDDRAGEIAGARRCGEHGHGRDLLRLRQASERNTIDASLQRLRLADALP